MARLNRRIHRGGRHAECRQTNGLEGADVTEITGQARHRQGFD